MVLLGAQNIPDTKNAWTVTTLVVVVYICVVYLLTLAPRGTDGTRGTDIAIGTFNKPVSHSILKCIYLPL